MADETVARWREAGFDLWQRLHPRTVESFPVAIVAIDEASLQQVGQWPWPRTRLAELLARIAADGALAIGFDILFAEPDRASPAAFARSYPGLDPALAASLATLRDTDELLADAIGRAPVVTARAGISGDEAGPWRAARIPAAAFTAGPPELARLPRADALIHALPVLEARASGFGVLVAPPDPDGVVRRLPLAWNIDGAAAPALAVEMLRVALGLNSAELQGTPEGGARLLLGENAFAVGADGVIRPWFSPAHAQRRVSAAAVLDGSLPAGSFANRLVLVGVTGVGTLDHVRTPLAVMDGVEVQAQAIETLLAAQTLTRPRWAPLAEGAAALLFSLLLIVGMARLRPAFAAVLGLALLLPLPAASFGLFRWQGWLVDAAWPALLVAAVFVTMLTGLLVASQRARRALERQLEAERLAAARMAGELQAAGTIQRALLPDSRALALPNGLGVYALLEPARDVGGDLFDLVRLDEDRLFFLVGDVTGKGVPASLFMAISKALCRSAVLRAGHEPDIAMATANTEISRENPSSMFVTAFLGVIDARSGLVEFCNAGHENPLIIGADGSCRELANEGGPPLCFMDDYPYPLERAVLAPGDTLVLVSDGVTEARGRDGSLLGRARLLQELASMRGFADQPERVAHAVRAIARAHEDGLEATDDLTVMALHRAGATAGDSTAGA